MADMWEKAWHYVFVKGTCNKNIKLTLPCVKNFAEWLTKNISFIYHTLAMGK